MSKPTKGTRVANIFGSFGYFSVLIQWFWFIAVIALPYMQNSPVRSLFIPSEKPSDHVITSSAVGLPPQLQLALTIVAIIFTLGIIIYAIYAIPRSVGKLGKAITQKSAAATVSHIKHHRKHMTEPERKRLYEYFTWSVKILLLLVPCVLLLLPTQTDLAISHTIILVVGTFCASMSAIWFSLQYAASRFAHSKPSEIW